MGAQGAGASVKIEGLSKLQRDLKQLDTGLTLELKAVNKAAAEMVASEVRNRAPVLTGRLKRSVRAGATLTAGVVRVGNTSTPYAKPIIFGWPAHGIRPNPFPYRALDARRAAVIALYGERVKAIERKAFR